MLCVQHTMMYQEPLDTRPGLMMLWKMEMQSKHPFALDYNNVHLGDSSGTNFTISRSFSLPTFGLEPGLADWEWDPCSELWFLLVLAASETCDVSSPPSSLSFCLLWSSSWAPVCLASCPHTGTLTHTNRSSNEHLPFHMLDTTRCSEQEIAEISSIKFF